MTQVRSDFFCLRKKIGRKNVVEKYFGRKKSVEKYFSTKIFFERKIFVFIENFTIRTDIKNCFSLCLGNVSIVRKVDEAHENVKTIR